MYLRAGTETAYTFRAAVEIIDIKEEGKKNNCMNISQRGNNAEVPVKETKRDTFVQGIITLTAARLGEDSFGIMAELSFNVDHGYLEGLVRGMKAGILTHTDYQNLAQCDTLEGETNISSAN